MVFYVYVITYFNIYLYFFFYENQLVDHIL